MFEISNCDAILKIKQLNICNGGKNIMFKKFNAGKVGLFVAGLAFGTAGIKILTSKDAKKVYTGCTAAVLRAKDTVVKTATTVQENAGDILAEAKQINADRAAAEAYVEDEEVTEAAEAQAEEAQAE